jgi:hypothetical protein
MEKNGFWQRVKDWLKDLFPDPIQTSVMRLNSFASRLLSRKVSIK